MTACPLMGFEEEKVVGQHQTDPDYWTQFYTCIANNKRVFLWAWAMTRTDCCVVIGYDPMRGASDLALREHMKTVWRGEGGKYHAPPTEPFLLQAFIHHITLKGNDND